MTNLRWYIVNTLSNYENKVANAINESIPKLNGQIAEVIVPVHETRQLRKGKKVSVEKKVFPGYVLVKMELNDQTWNLVKNIPKVSGLLGIGGTPTPVSEAEIENLFKQIKDVQSLEKAVSLFKIGDEVKIKAGPFETFTGFVEEINKENDSLMVSLSIFGRSSVVELNFTQVEKVK